MLVLCAFAREYGPFIILLEDLRLFDALSLQLVAEVAQQLNGSCLLVATLRPNSGIFEPASSTQVAILKSSKL